MNSESSLSAVRAVTFDFYLTLAFPTAGQGRGSRLMEYLDENGLESDPWDHQVLYDVFEPHGVGYGPGSRVEEVSAFCRAFARRLFQRLNVKASEAVASAHAENLWRILGPASFSLFSDVNPTLRLLRRQGYPLAVVSNWQRGLLQFCRDLGLGQSFEHVLSSAEVGSSKPDPKIFADACRRLGMPAHTVLHVGDSVVEDYEGGDEAGLQVVLIRRQEDSTSFDGTAISSLLQLPALLGIRDDALGGEPAARRFEA